MNKNPATKKRPDPHSSSHPPPVEGPSSDKKLKPLPLLSILYPISSPEPEDGSSLDINITIPNPRVPLYNGLALMPSRSLRAALYQKLNHLLFVERRARSRQEVQRSAGTAPSSSAICGQQSHAGEKPSHAYLLCSDAGTLLRADSVLLAIALWRLRMWEGEGWKERWKIILLPDPKR